MLIFRFALCFLLLCTGLGAQAPAPKSPPQGKQPPKPAPPKKETFGQWLSRITGISVTPNMLRGDDPDFAGDIWIAELKTNTQRRLTRTGRYRSPVFLPGETQLLALKDNTVVKLALDGGAEEPMASLSNAEKLVGASAAGTAVLFVAKDKEQIIVGVLDWQTKQITRLDYDQEADAKMIAHLRGWERVYDGGSKVLFTQTETKEVADKTVLWSNVYYRQGQQAAQNISRCDGVNCGQPALSTQARMVAYIKQN